jgi:ethanolamine utilization protein EutM
MDELRPPVQERAKTMDMELLKGKALGIIETRSLTAAIEAADAMMKAAKVDFIGEQRTGRGLVTVMVTGSLGAVEAAVNAGAERARRLSNSVTTLIIPGPHGDIECILSYRRKWCAQ